jgi:DNA-binding response OmpR family regulator
MQILIVDDDEDIREVLELVLTTQGHEVETACDGLEALERLHAGSRPGLIILDLMMPRLDGEELMRLLARDRMLSQIPVMIVTGHETGRSRAAALGAMACLMKPLELDDLMAAVNGAERRNEPLNRPA